MWLGPAPQRPYNPHRGIYHFRWFWDYSGGQMTNLGAHEIDIVQWVLGVAGPTAVFSERRALRPRRTTAKRRTRRTRCSSIPASPPRIRIREASAGRRAGAGLEFFGTKGSMTVVARGFEVFPDMKIDPANAIPVFPGTARRRTQRTTVKPEPWIEADEGTRIDRRAIRPARAQLPGLREEPPAPIADVEGGHRTATACHLANISLRLGRKLSWDPSKEEILGDREASAMLERPYRKPWDAVLRGLLS